MLANLALTIFFSDENIMTTPMSIKQRQNFKQFFCKIYPMTHFYAYIDSCKLLLEVALTRT